MSRFWTALRMRTARLRVRWQWFTSSRFGKRVLWGAQQALTVGIGGYLLYQMTGIGWGKIWQSLPGTPWFYVVFLGGYLSLPLFEALAYRVIWAWRLLDLLPAMLKKRVYDKDVLGRSGDVYLYFWGRAHVDHSDRELLHHVKDNAIASSGASTLVAGILLGVFLVLGYVSLPEFIARRQWAYGVGSVVLFAGIGAAVVRFRRTVFLLPGRTLGLLFGVHLARVCVQKLLLVGEWMVALPGIGLGTWFAFLAIRILTTRIPLFSGRELLFVAAGIELAGAVGVSRAAIAGLLGVHSVLDKTLNLAVFAGVSVWERQVVERFSTLIGVGGPSGPVTEVPSPESSPAS